MKRIGVLTSGGDAPGMNAAIRAVVRCGLSKGFKVFGINRGYEGLIEADIVEMEARTVGDILQRGGTILKTARSKRFMTEEGVEKGLQVLDTFGISDLVVIGGDGTFRGGAELAKRGINVMGLPGTIDNDMGYTDFTIGFDTAVSTVLDGISKLRDTSSSHERTTLIEVMGRYCGDIALYAGITGGAEFVLVPERDFDINEICQRVLMSINEGKQHSIILKAEGIEIPSQLLVDEISKKTGRDAKLVVLSYLQRGGSPTMRDRILATMSAAKAVDLIEECSTSKAIGMVDGRIIAMDLLDAVTIKREFNQEIYDLIGVLS